MQELETVQEPETELELVQAKAREPETAREQETVQEQAMEPPQKTKTLCQEAAC